MSANQPKEPVAFSPFAKPAMVFEVRLHPGDMARAVFASETEPELLHALAERYETAAKKSRLRAETFLEVARRLRGLADFMREDAT